MMTRVYISCLLLIIVYGGYSQSLSGLIINEEAQPVPDAFVFISNSNYGVVTQEDGTFELDVSGLEHIELTVSQINYKLIIQKVALNTTYVEIVLSSRSNELGSVEFVKEYDPNIRKRRLKRFKEALLGEESKGKKIEILNPDDILLYHDGVGLRIETNVPVRIENLYLGYMVHFHVKDFILFDNDDLKYEGSLYFKELEMKKSDWAKAKKNRRRTYKSSSQYFMRQMILGHDINGYTLSIGTNLGATYNEQFTRINHDDLLFRYNPKDHTYRLLIGTILRIYDKRHDTDSFLAPTESIIIMDRFGNITNSKQVEEFGYWSKRRMTSQLPFDYIP